VETGARLVITQNPHPPTPSKRATSLDFHGQECGILAYKSNAGKASTLERRSLENYMNAAKIIQIVLVSCVLLVAVVILTTRVLLPAYAILKVDSNEYSRVPSPDGSKEIVFVESSPGVLAHGRVQCYLVGSGGYPGPDNLFCSILGTYDKFVSGKWIDQRAIEVRVARASKKYEKRKTSFAIKNKGGVEYINIRYVTGVSP
jgi:hypothetical protein